MQLGEDPQLKAIVSEDAVKCVANKLSSSSLLNELPMHVHMYVYTDNIKQTTAIRRQVNDQERASGHIVNMYICI